MYFSIKIILINELENKNGSNNISLRLEIHRSLDVSISDSNLYKREFNIQDAIPISLNLESFNFIKTNCMHGMLHIFRLPIRTEIKWKIQGGIDNGAFKIGNGMDAEYFPRDSGDSVIFYPQLQSSSKNLTYKKICIELTVRQQGSRIFKEEEYRFFVNVNILITKKFARRTFRAKVFVSKQEDPDNDNDNKIDNYISKSKVIDFDTLKPIFATTTKKKEEKEGKNYQVSFKAINSCKICNLSLLIQIKTNTLYPFSIKGLKSYLITSDIIKVSAETNTKKSITNNDSSIILTGSNYKKYFIDNIQIQPRIFWKSTIGNLVYGNLGQSLIYYTPGESELSKSPITISLYFQYDHNLEDFQQAILSDSKKMWMLRQPPLRLF
jgi:hypothetical protein